MKKSLQYILCILFLLNFHICAQINQVIVPMAGLGTRLLPLTKAASKSMVPLVDRPALHHIVDEALESGINDFCYIINEQEQEAIAAYFSPNSMLDGILDARNKSYQSIFRKIAERVFLKPQLYFQDSPAATFIS